MNRRSFNRRAAAPVLFLILILALAAVVSAAPQRQTPPEYKEIVAASQMKDPATRLKELERIKAAYPNAAMAAAIDQLIVNTKVELAPNLDEVLSLQKLVLASAKGPYRLVFYLQAASQILEHPKLASFGKAKVLAAVLKYRQDAVKTAAEPEIFKEVPEDQRNFVKTTYLTGLDVPVAGAYLQAGDPAKALAALEGYKAAGGAPDAYYFSTLGGTLEARGKSKEALDAYLNAAIEGDAAAANKAKAVYVKLNGKADGFEAAVEAKVKALPFHPEPFKAPADGKGKTVLAEIFTGSECPPCVGADLGFDGLIEAYPARYLAVLEYHLPIPRPDPMMNPATKKRQEYYGVNSTPTTFFDGEAAASGGGSRGMAEGKFKQYKAEIDRRIAASPAVTIKAKAVRTGDAVKVDVELDKVPAGAETYIVLVQNTEPYQGSNGIVFHKMVVRDLALLPAGGRSATFNLAASEKAADAYLTDFEKTSTRFQGFKFPERHAKIDRKGLRIVAFVQETAGKKVLNTAIADVK